MKLMLDSVDIGCLYSLFLCQFSEHHFVFHQVSSAMKPIEIDYNYTMYNSSNITILKGTMMYIYDPDEEE